MTSTHCNQCKRALLDIKSRAIGTCYRCQATTEPPVKQGRKKKEAFDRTQSQAAKAITASIHKGSEQKRRRS